LSKIEVRYTPAFSGNGSSGWGIPLPNGRPAEHKYLVFTDDNGNPDKGIRFGGELVPGFPGTTLVGREGLWNENDFENFREFGRDRGEVLKENASQADWDRVKEKVQEINNRHLPYALTYPNSSTGLDEAIFMADLPSPKDDSSAPGSGIDLPGGPDSTDPTQRDSWSDFWDRIRDFFVRGKTASPIVFDLDGDGVETSALRVGAYFDHDGNGFAEQTGWVQGGGLHLRHIELGRLRQLIRHREHDSVGKCGWHRNRLRCAGDVDCRSEHCRAAGQHGRER